MILSFLVSGVVFSLIYLISSFISNRRFKKTEKYFQTEVDKANLYKQMIINRNNFMLLELEGFFEKNHELKRFVEKNNQILDRVGLKFDLNCLIRQAAKNDEDEEKRFKRFKKEIENCPEEVKKLIFDYNCAFKELIRIRFPWLHRRILAKNYYNRALIKYIFLPLLNFLEEMKRRIEEKEKCENKEECEDIQYGIKIFDFSKKIDASLEY